jgi:hypothetical protein
MKYIKEFLFVLILFASFTCRVMAQEENVISIALYNFTRYIDWPTGKGNQDFYIDIVGHKSVFDKLKEMTAGRKVGNRNIVVRYIETADKITESEMLFLGFWQSKDISKALDKIKNSNTLLITEKDGLIDSGAAINFIISNNAFKFEIKKANIVKYGLVLSEALEQMAMKTY